MWYYVLCFSVSQGEEVRLRYTTTTTTTTNLSTYILLRLCSPVPECRHSDDGVSRGTGFAEDQKILVYPISPRYNRRTRQVPAAREFCKTFPFPNLRTTNRGQKLEIRRQNPKHSILHFLLAHHKYRYVPPLSF